MRETTNLSCRIYRVLLAAYPAEFRREYGPSMLQVFRDSSRDAAMRQRKFATANFWLTMLSDLVVSASKQHMQNFGQENGAMNNMRRDLIAVAGCVVIILAAFMLLSYGRAHEVGPVLVFGRVLDAVVFTGIIGNLVVFLLVKITKWVGLVSHRVLDFSRRDCATGDSACCCWEQDRSAVSPRGNYLGLPCKPRLLGTTPLSLALHCQERAS